MVFRCMGRSVAVCLGEEGATSGPLPGLRHTHMLSPGAPLKEQAEKSWHIWAGQDLKDCKVPFTRRKGW